ncbi:MAG: ArsR/SmtB family transcription factor [Nanobdellota archaeon]
MRISTYKPFFDTIANETRLKILESLTNESLSVNEISEKTEEEQSKVSHNLKLLARCHFVDSKREGKKIIYSLNGETIRPLMELAKKHVKTNCSNIELRDECDLCTEKCTIKK